MKARKRKKNRKVQIRKITSDDTESVKTLIQNIMQTEFSAESKAYSLYDLDDAVHYYGGTKDIFLVAEKDGNIIGTVAIKEDSSDTALLRRIFVVKDFRGKGYGDKLVGEALDFCFNHNYQTVTFRGTDRMKQALKVCLKQGFKEDDIVITDDFKMFVLTKKLKPHKSTKASK